VLEVNPGALDPPLQRLENDGLHTSEWGTTYNIRRARYDRITASRSSPSRTTGSAPDSAAALPRQASLWSP
jgi:hypothetical protein